MKEHNILHGHQVGQLDPFSGNLLVIYIYKLLSITFSSLQHYKLPEINYTFYKHLEYEEYF